MSPEGASTLIFVGPHSTLDETATYLLRITEDAVGRCEVIADSTWEHHGAPARRLILRKKTSTYDYAFVVGRASEVIVSSGGPGFAYEAAKNEIDQLIRSITLDQ